MTLEEAHAIVAASEPAAPVAKSVHKLAHRQTKANPSPCKQCGGQGEHFSKRPGDLLTKTVTCSACKGTGAAGLSPIKKALRESFAKSTLPKLADLQEQQLQLAAAVETMLKRRR